MEENLPNDNLERFFRKQLREDAAEAQSTGWDTPDDAVWENVAAVVQPEKKERKLFYMWWWVAAASVILLVILYQTYSCNQQLQTLAEQVQASQEKIETINDRIITKEKSNDFEQKNVIDLSTIDNEIVAENNQVHNTTADVITKKELIQTAKEIETITDNNLVSIIRSTTVPITSNDTTFDTNLSKKIFTTDVSKNENAAKQEFIEELTATTADYLNKVVPPLHKPISPIASRSANDKNLFPHRVLLDTRGLGNVSYTHHPSFYLTATTIFNNGTRTIEAETAGIQRLQQLRSQENERSQQGYGLQFGYQFHKNWSLETGVHYGRSTIDALHRTQFQFRRDIEQSNGNESQSQYALSLSSSYGDASTDVTISRPQDVEVNNGIRIRLQLATTRPIRYVDIPLLLKYQRQQGKLYYGAQLGLNLRRIAPSSVEITGVRFSNNIDGLRPNIRQRITRALNQPATSLLNYNVGLHLEYHLSPHWRLVLQPNFTRSFQPLFEKENVATYAQTWGVHTGLSYRF